MSQLLGKLPDSYCDEYSKWWLIGDACKNSNNWLAFDNWSSSNPDKYNEEINKQLWNTWVGCLSVNYIIDEVNKHVTKSDEEKSVGPVRVYNDLKNNTLPIINIKEKHIKANMLDKKKFKTILVKSVKELERQQQQLIFAMTK